MSQNRSSERSTILANAPVVVETLRQASEPSKEKDEGKDENKIPVFWRVFGGTVLSIVALVVLTAYQGLTGSMAELRNELSHLETDTRKEMARFNETQGDLVEEEELASRIRSFSKSLTDLQADCKEMPALRKQCEGLLEQLKEGDRERRKLEEEICLLRQEQAAELQRQTLRAELAMLRERLAGMEGKRQNVQRARPRPTKE